MRITAKIIEQMTPVGIIKAQDNVQACRNMTMTFKSKAIKHLSVQVGDMVEVFQKKQHHK